MANMQRNKQIVCISTQYWDEPWFRKQQFMSRFAVRGWSIAYIEPSFSILKGPPKNKRDIANNHPVNVKIERYSKNITLIKPPMALPFWYYPFWGEINYFYFSFVISATLKRIGFKNYILWLYWPLYLHGLKNFHYRKLVFDISDDFSGYLKYNQAQSNFLSNNADTLANRSDMVWTTATKLFTKYRSKITPEKLHLIPNGFDDALFDGKKQFPCPTELKNLPRPLIGFVGTIFSYLDFELIQFLAENNRDFTFVFVGPCESNIERKFTRILQNKNAVWLGKKTKDSIPGFVNQFSVCINPFKAGSMADSINPLKVYEYLALRKKVVSVKMESLEEERISRYISFAEDFYDFDKKLKSAVQDQAVPSGLDEDILSYTWDALFERAYSLIQNL